MPSDERRSASRKACAIPVRFRAVDREFPGSSGEPAGAIAGAHATPIPAESAALLSGEAVNLSERGICFTSRQEMNAGQPLEIILTLPGELTGRPSERVRCSARVVHVHRSSEREGMKSIGAMIETFEPLNLRPNWTN